MKDLIIKTEESLGNKSEEILEYITEHPEVGGKEYIAANYLSTLLKEYGFDVETNYKNFPTAFYASLKNGNGPKVGFLAKYDALPNFDENGNDAHGCGHNWIASVFSGVGMVLSKMKENFSGELVIIGLPSEVPYGEKILPLTDENWKTFDAVFATHLNGKSVFHSFPLTINTLEFEYFGKSSHAFSYPEKGINALDALLNSITKMKEIPLAEKERISINICDGGKSTEKVPDYTRMRVAVGGPTKKQADTLANKVTKIVNEESQKLNVTCNSKLYNEFYDLNKIPELYTLMAEAFDTFEEEYLVYPEERVGTALDISPVGYLCPMIYMFFGVENWTSHQPSVQRIAASHSEHAKKMMHKAIQIFTYCALKVFNDNEFTQQLKQSFQESINKYNLS